MIAAFFHCAADTERLHDLLVWIDQLGGCQRHDALLVADAATPYSDCAQARKLALKSFREVRCISNAKSVTGWPAGPNSLFRAAAGYIAGKWPQPWLVVEPDCVPLQPGWLDRIECDYRGRLVSYMGCHYEGRDTVTGKPVKAMSGIGVYPASGVRELQLPDDIPWDMANREQLLEDSYNTPLIHHFYGLKDLAPTFVEKRDNPHAINVCEVASIPESAVLFHRCKDGSLIRCLRKRMGIDTHEPKSLTLDIAYVVVAHSPNNLSFVSRFIRSYEQFPPSEKCQVVAVSNGGPPNPTVAGLFQRANIPIRTRTNLGWDIGAYQDIAQQTESDLLVCLGESVYFHRKGWLTRIADAYREFGPGMYGCYSSFLVRPHLPTTAFACSPKFLREYPRAIDHKTRYNFEHGTNSLWLKIKSQGGAVKLVTWDGVYDQPNWRKPANLLWSGDQSNCLVFSNHTDRFKQADPAAKLQLNHGANGTKRLVPVGQ